MAKIHAGDNVYEVAVNSAKPMAPPVTGDGTIFVSLVSYRDGERCAETIQSIFKNAKNPDKVHVGLVEQNSPEDAFCLEAYCKLHDVEIQSRDHIRKDLTQLMQDPEATERCPHIHQIRLLGIHHYGAKGPIYARSLMRKVLGNEEFCLQLDAHSSLAPGWDEGLAKEWQATQNEFAVLSTVPPPVSDQKARQPGGAGEAKVPRQCSITFRDNGVPDFESVQDDASIVADLGTTPLLSHGWSAGFSFHKCHLEETVPYDPFSHYAKPVEQFTRYARMWTRGYDVYTPTRNYAFSHYTEQANGHGGLEWFKMHQKNRFRLMAIDRAKLVLELPNLSQESDTLEADRANLGIYGLGQRRSLEQLQKFTGIQLQAAEGNPQGATTKCGATAQLVPYEASISPMANLHHEGATKLDPPPIFPLRTRRAFSTHHVTSAEKAHHLEEWLDTKHLHIAVQKDGDGIGAHKLMKNPADVLALPHVELQGLRRAFGRKHHGRHEALGPEMMMEEQVNLPPSSVLFVLWFFGLIIWCFVFAMPNTSGAGRDDKTWLGKKVSKQSASSASTGTSTKKTSNTKRKTKIVKDV